MREYELTVVYDLAVAEAGGPEASVDQLTQTVEARGGKILRVDHWGRRRMAYPINRVIDADYIVSRVELEPDAVAPIEAALRINEQVFRHLIVRADELPAPLPPREPRPMPAAPANVTGAPETPATTAAAPVAAEAAPAEGEAPASSGTIASEAPAEAAPEGGEASSDNPTA